MPVVGAIDLGAVVATHQSQGGPFPEPLSNGAPYTDSIGGEGKPTILAWKGVGNETGLPVVQVQSRSTPRVRVEVEGEVEGKGFYVEAEVGRRKSTVPIMAHVISPDGTKSGTVEIYGGLPSIEGRIETALGRRADRHFTAKLLKEICEAVRPDDINALLISDEFLSKNPPLEPYRGWTVANTGGKPDVFCLPGN